MDPKQTEPSVWAVSWAMFDFVKKWAQSRTEIVIKQQELTSIRILEGLRPSFRVYGACTVSDVKADNKYCEHNADFIFA